VIKANGANYISIWDCQTLSQTLQEKWPSWANQNRISIEQGWEIVKAQIGDWEGDSYWQGHKGALLTLARPSILLIVPLQGKQSDKLAQAVIDVMGGIKSQVLTITYDNGKEFADHELMG